MMKKTVALILAMILVLFSVSAMAAGSKQNKDMNKATTTDRNVSISKAADTDTTSALKQTVKDAQAAGDVMSAFPASIVSRLPADRRTVNEMDTYQVSSVSGADYYLLIFQFATPFENGEKVPVLFGITKENGETEWLEADGKGNKDGAVEVKVSRGIFNKLQKNPFVVIPISK